MIIKEAIGLGSTVEAAREDAIAKLNADLDDDVQFEIVAFPKKKVLGIFGGNDAQVRAFVDDPNVQPKKEKPAKSENKPKKTVKAEKMADKVEKVAKTEEKATVEDKKEEPVGIPASEVDPSSQAGKAYKYLADVLLKLGCENIDAIVSEIEGGSKIVLKGSDKLGVIIGRRGETLDALQYLASLVANDNGGGYYRVVIDVGNYREKRESTLEALAKRTAGQVLRTGRNRSLEPMNPYERRIIHTTVQDIEGVTSTSIGDGANRRVVIVPEGKQVRLTDNRERKNRGSRGGNRPNRSSESVKEAPVVQKPKETDGTKLYGKLK